MLRAFRHDRRRWVAYLRECHARQEYRRKYDDGMSHGIIPFGACHYWYDLETKRVEAAVAKPVAVRVVDMDEIGLTVAVTCPYCKRLHEHILTERPEKPTDAPCAYGKYILDLPSH